MPLAIGNLHSFKDVEETLIVLAAEQERLFNELKQEIVYLNERMDALEAIHSDIFSLDLERLKERRDKLYDSLSEPISDTTKNNINNEIVKIERLISFRMKE